MASGTYLGLLPAQTAGHLCAGRKHDAEPVLVGRNENYTEWSLNIANIVFILVWPAVALIDIHGSVVRTKFTTALSMPLTFPSQTTRSTTRPTIKKTDTLHLRRHPSHGRRTSKVLPPRTSYSSDRLPLGSLMSPVAYLTATLAIQGFYVAPTAADTIAKCTLDYVTISDGGTSFQVAIMIAVSRLAVYDPAFGGRQSWTGARKLFCFAKSLMQDELGQ